MSQSPLAADYDGHNLVFVAGCPRSGTTWLQRLLASHPKIRTGQESHLFGQYVGPQLKNLREGINRHHHRPIGLGCYFTEEEFIPILKSYLLKLLEPMVVPLGPGELFLEKSPSNALFLPEILELLPRARLIHVLRDARDTVSSMTSQEEWLSVWAPDNARDAALTWVEHVRAVWDATPNIPSGQFHEVRYTGLLRNPVEVLRGTTGFLGLDWSPAEIEDAVKQNLPSNARANGGTMIPLSGEVAKHAGPILIEPEGFIRKVNPGSWKSDLSFLEKLWVWKIAGETMEAADYHWSRPMAFAFACLSTPLDLATALWRILRGSKIRQQPVSKSRSTSCDTPARIAEH